MSDEIVKCSECGIGPQISKINWALLYRCQSCKKQTFCYIVRKDAKKEWNGMNSKKGNDGTVE